MGVEGLRAINDSGRELRMQFLENRFGKPCSDVADCLVGVGGAVVAGEQEGAVNRGAFAFAVVSAEDHEVEGVAYSRKIILLDLKPISTALAWFVTAFGSVKHLDHEAFAGCLDGFVEEGLDFVDFLTVHACCETKFAFDGDKCGMKELASFAERLLDYCLAVQEEEIECEDTDFDLDILDLDILLFFGS